MCDDEGVPASTWNRWAGMRTESQIVSKGVVARVEVVAPLPSLGFERENLLRTSHTTIRTRIDN